MSYHYLGAASEVPALPAPMTPPAVSPTTAVVVEPANPVTVTIGIPGLNAVVPLTSRNRIWLAIGMSVVVGIVGGIGIAKLIKQAQK